jgi:hypothetical protein
MSTRQATRTAKTSPGKQVLRRKKAKSIPLFQTIFCYAQQYRTKASLIKLLLFKAAKS